jgi:uncharacterized protein (TIGR02246 family)
MGIGRRRAGGILLLVVSFPMFATNIAADSKTDLDTINQQKAGAASTPEKEVYDQIVKMVDAWNRHDLDAYLDGFVHSDDVVVVVEGETVRGWDLLSRAYHGGYPDPKEMGAVTLDRVQVQMLAPDLGFVLASYTITFPKKKQFGTDTVIMKKVPEGWRELVSNTSFVEP